MKIMYAFILLCISRSVSCQAQTAQNIHTSDIDHFWNAYDSICATTDKTLQLHFIQTLYIEKASEGLQAFLRNKDNPGNKWVNLVNSDRQYWDSIRKRSLLVKEQAGSVQKDIDRLTILYPALKNAGTYFIIGFRQQGGTTRGNCSIIGTEVILSSLQADRAALRNLVVHEYVHTQQQKPDFQHINVLTSAIREGACDFVAGLVTQQQSAAPYMQYGSTHEVALWRVFVQDMFTHANDLWVSTGDNPVIPVRDPGYFIGYAICQSYYKHAADKQKALKDIIEINYADTAAVTRFLEQSGYQNELLSKGYSPADKIPVYGYTKKGPQVIFQLQPGSETIVSDSDGSTKRLDIQKEPVHTISIAGSFNNWKENDPAYTMKKSPGGQYVLQVNKEKLGKAGDTLPFHFIINNHLKLVPPFAIRNRMMDPEGNIHLAVEL